MVKQVFRCSRGDEFGTSPVVVRVHHEAEAGLRAGGGIVALLFGLFLLLMTHTRRTLGHVPYGFRRMRRISEVSGYTSFARVGSEGGGHATRRVCVAFPTSWWRETSLRQHCSQGRLAETRQGGL